MANHTDAEAPTRREPPRWVQWVDAGYRPFTNAVGALGSYFYFIGQFFGWLVRPPYRVSNLVDQMEFVGVGSLPIVLLVAFFTGAVFALQTVDAARIYHGEVYVGMAVAVMLAREIAPVFAAIMVTARVGSGMATELGSMRITEQIDALSTLAVNPIQYLVVPRVAATTIMVPVLAMAYNVVGLIGCYVVAVLMKDVDRGLFMEYLTRYVDLNNYWHGLVKAVFFGFDLSVIACFQGYNAGGGAKGVGLATTKSVVLGCVTILVIDYILTDIMMSLNIFQAVAN
jgi:phospholipid/cholesterol/gamma-HCH transport system permease protein